MADQWSEIERRIKPGKWSLLREREIRALLAAAREGAELRRAGSPSHVALWDAINAYMVACGGSASRISTARMNAVVGVEAALAGKGAAMANRVHPPPKLSAEERVLLAASREIESLRAQVAALTARAEAAEQERNALNLRAVHSEARVGDLDRALLDVHDAMHRECSSGHADLPDEIRALRARAEAAEAKATRLEVAIPRIAAAVKEWCAQCGGSGAYPTMPDGGPQCCTCCEVDDAARAAMGEG